MTSNKTDAHAAYGELFPTVSGELLFTRFTQTQQAAATARERAGSHVAGPVWTLEMGVVGDPERVSTVVVPQPYMGLGAQWPTPTTSWAETNYTNMCINSCWELYGASDRAHLPGSGARYDIQIEQFTEKFAWVEQWDEDEGGQKACPASHIHEKHNQSVQHVLWDIYFPGAGWGGPGSAVP